MATIYRFIVENQIRESGGSGRTPKTTAPKKTVAKTGRAVSLFGGDKGGVEHNRKMRAINPLLNRATGGWWEKSTRLGRAGMGLIKVNSQTGAFMGFSPVAIAILVSFAIQSTLKLQKRHQEIANKQNTQNYKALENGYSAIHGEFNVTRNYWDGKLTYNENK